MSRTKRAIASIVTSTLATVMIGGVAVVSATPASADTYVTDRAIADPTVFSAGSRMVGITTNTWGRFDTDQAISVWTEVHISGAWHRSQTRTTTETGDYVIPLTYGSTTAGSYRYRVAGQYADGRIVRTAEFTLVRLAKPTAYTAGNKLVGAGTNTWGRFDTDRAMTVWTEVELRAGVWSRSQSTTTTSSGSFVIPLTYGASTPGTYRFRVAGQHPNGEMMRSDAFTLRRLANPVAYSAGTKNVNEVTNTWGRFDTDRAMTVWTEVELRAGVWSRSQSTTTTSSGSFVIPLTYGASTPGTYRFRVVGQYPGGEIARSNTFTLKRESAKNMQAVKFAYEQIGDAYAYGGTGPSSWDCSGLTGGAWKSAGVYLPRTSQDQYAAGRKVAKSDLQPGDLIFYYSGRSHVAIYVGNGEIIHASRPGKPVEKVSMHLMPYNGAVRPA